MTSRPVSLTPPPNGYTDWLAELKTRIHSAQQRAALAVNRELVLLYWQIGRDILERQAREGWGAKVIDRLAHDLRTAFPDMKGFSPRNLKYMRAFAQAWPEAEFVQQAAARLPWFHLCTLIDKLKTREERDWYLAQAAEHNWSRNVLEMQIETQARTRSGQALNNFETRLPAPRCRPSCKPVCQASSRSKVSWAIRAAMPKRRNADGLGTRRRRNAPGKTTGAAAVRATLTATEMSF